MATYYAGIGGSSGNAGTSWGARKALPSQAYALASAGDTIYIGPGSYNDNIGTAIDGSSGNLITMIGDYTGANTDGVGGVVRMYSATASAIGSYNTWRRIYFSSPNSGTAALIVCDGKSEVIIEQCAFSNVVALGLDIRTGSNRTVRQCFFFNVHNQAVYIRSYASGATNCGDVIENCVLMGVGGNNAAQLYIYDMGGVTVRNCALIGGSSYAVDVGPLPGGYTAVNVNNCHLFGLRFGMRANTLGMLLENYNAFGSTNTARTNVSSGANSVTMEGPLDPRWWFELVGGGSMVSPFDLASFSSLVELNSGTGAPSADARGTTVQGTYREWGPLEYDSTLDIEAGAGGGGGPVIGSRVIQGLGAI